MVSGAEIALWSCSVWSRVDQFLVFLFAGRNFGISNVEAADFGALALTLGIGLARYYFVPKGDLGKIIL